jgi:hypothetical protein
LCSREVPRDISGGWEPTAIDIQSLEARFPKIADLREEGWIKSPEKYYRQYVGVVIGKQKLIYINASCDREPPSNWRTRLVNVCDGGCDWGALYDPQTGTFSELHTNGIA